MRNDDGPLARGRTLPYAGDASACSRALSTGLTPFPAAELRRAVDGAPQAGAGRRGRRARRSRDPRRRRRWRRRRAVGALARSRSLPRRRWCSRCEGEAAGTRVPRSPNLETRETTWESSTTRWRSSPARRAASAARRPSCSSSQGAKVLINDLDADVAEQTAGEIDGRDRRLRRRPDQGRRRRRARQDRDRRLRARSTSSSTTPATRSTRRSTR